MYQGEKTVSIDSATLQMLDKARIDGVETAWDRQDLQRNVCGFGAAGVCCTNCVMGPCRVSPIPGKGADKGICGANADVIVSRNFARMVAAGTAAHADHGRSICLDLYHASENGDIKVRDPEKLMLAAERFNVETKGRSIYDIAKDVAKAGLEDYGRAFGEVNLAPCIPAARKELWKKEDLIPRSIDREVVSIMHATHIGCTADAEAMVKAALRCSLGDGWLGSYMATEFSDIMFGTPQARSTEANLGVLEEKQVNIVLHGHEPTLSEMIVAAAELPEMMELAKSVGATGINLCGMCCTANEVTMRHGVKLAGNFLQQELAVITGAVEALVVDVQCIFPALTELSANYHTKFITTSPKARVAGSTYIELDEHDRMGAAKKIIKEAILNYPNRDSSKVNIPNAKSEAEVGYSVEQILAKLGGKANSQADKVQMIKPLVDVVAKGLIKGAVAIVGCNNIKSTQDEGHVEIMKGLIKNDILIVATGCSAQAAAKHGLLKKEAKELAGPGLKQVCELVGIPPILHMGSCVDISRIMELVGLLASHLGVDISALPVAGIAPEYMSEKALAIGCYVVTSGVDTWLGVVPPVTGSPQVVEILTNKVEEWVGAKFYVEPSPRSTVEQVTARINEKRTKLGI